MIEGSFYHFPIDGKSARLISQRNVVLRKTRKDKGLRSGMVVKIIPLDGRRSITRKVLLAHTPLKSDQIGLSTDSKKKMYGRLPPAGCRMDLIIEDAGFIRSLLFHALLIGLPPWLSNLAIIISLLGTVFIVVKWLLKILGEIKR